MLIRLCILLMSFSSLLTASIVEIESIKEIEAYFSSEPQDILGVFDIDETLLVSADPVFQKPNMKAHAPLVKGFYQQFPLTYQDVLSNYILFSSPSQVIEQESVALLKRLQAQGIRLIALTAALTRPFPEGMIPELRQQELLRHGFDFSSAFSDIEDLAFDRLPPCHGHYPRYYKGVFCSNGDFNRHATATPKGQVLCALLEHVQWRPAKIVFVDDKHYNLEEMEQTLAEFDPSIDFHGLHYRGAEKLKVSPVSADYMQSRWEQLFQRVLQDYQEQVHT